MQFSKDILETCPEFGDVLRDLRMRREWTLLAAAIHCNMSRNRYWELERKKSIPPDDLYVENMAKGFEVAPVDKERLLRAYECSVVRWRRHGKPCRCCPLRK